MMDYIKKKNMIKSKFNNNALFYIALSLFSIGILFFFLFDFLLEKIMNLQLRMY